MSYAVKINGGNVGVIQIGFFLSFEPLVRTKITFAWIEITIRNIVKNSEKKKISFSMAFEDNGDKHLGPLVKFLRCCRFAHLLSQPGCLLGPIHGGFRWRS